MSEHSEHQESFSPIKATKLTPKGRKNRNPQMKEKSQEIIAKLKNKPMIQQQSLPLNKSQSKDY